MYGTLVLILTTDCPLDCSYCYAHYKNTNEYMEYETAIEAVHEMHKTHPDGFHISFLGGEPLMNWPVIEKILPYIEEHKELTSSITTNMVLLTEDMARKFCKAGTQFLISIDGTRSVHNKHRSGSYDKVVESFNILKKVANEYNIPMSKFAARATVNPDVANLAYDGVVSLYNLGFRVIHSVPRTDCVWTISQLNDYKINTQKIIDFYFEHHNENFYISGIDAVIQWGIDGVEGKRDCCKIGTDYNRAIDVHGRVMPCHQWCFKGQDKYLGSMKDRETWETKKPVVHEQCNSCSAEPYCNNGCLSENYSLNGDFFTPTKAFCDLANIYHKLISDNLNRIFEYEFKNELINDAKRGYSIKQQIDNFLSMSLLNKKWNDEFTKIKELLKNSPCKYAEYLSKKLIIHGGGKLAV